MQSDSGPKYSEEMTDVLHSVPPWLTRWGATAVTFAVATLFLIGSIIQYPDTLQGRAVVSSGCPTVSVEAMTSGRVDSIYIRNHESVQDNAVVLSLESSALVTSAVAVQAALSTWDAALLFGDSAIAQVELGEVGHLGEMQSAWSNFCEAVRIYQEILTSTFERRQMTALESERAVCTRLCASMRKRQDNQQVGVALAEKDLRLCRELFAQGLTSESEVRQSERALVASQDLLQDTEAELLQASLQCASLEERAHQLSWEVIRRKRDAWRDLKIAEAVIRGKLEQWEQTYLVRVPVSGSVSMVDVWAKGQPIVQGQKVAVIRPITSAEPMGKMRLTQFGSGSVRVGQRVRIALDGYPFLQYGYLNGVVSHISVVPEDTAAVVDIDLPQDLRTTQGIVLQEAIGIGIYGNAEIFLEERSILRRILARILHATSERIKR